MLYMACAFLSRPYLALLLFLIEVDGEDVFLFDLTMTEKFDTKKGTKKKTLEEATQVEGVEEENTDDAESMPVEAVKAPPLSDFSEKITSTYGETVEEDRARRQQDLSSFSEVQ